MISFLHPLTGHWNSAGRGDAGSQGGDDPKIQISLQHPSCPWQGFMLMFQEKAAPSKHPTDGPGFALMQERGNLELRLGILAIKEEKRT